MGVGGRCSRYYVIPILGGAKGERIHTKKNGEGQNNRKEKLSFRRHSFTKGKASKEISVQKKKLWEGKNKGKGCGSAGGWSIDHCC